MAAGHPIELRERIVQAHSQQGLSADEIADIFQVSVATVRRYIRCLNSGDSLAPRFSTGRRPKLGESEFAWLRAQIKKDPYLTSYELTTLYNKQFKVNRVHRSTILRAMHTLGFTHKKRRQ